VVPYSYLPSRSSILIERARPAAGVDAIFPMRSCIRKAGVPSRRPRHAYHSMLTCRNSFYSAHYFANLSTYWARCFGLEAITPAGEYTSKSTYKHCFTNLALLESQRPKTIPLQVVHLLTRVCREKAMVSWVHTFTWRGLCEWLSQQASKMVSSLNIFLEIVLDVVAERMKCTLPSFVTLLRLLGFPFPSTLQLDCLLCITIPSLKMINGLLDSNHPHINIARLHTFLWCIWKARNDASFGRKFCKAT
jgi:hypothetical protein